MAGARGEGGASARAGAGCGGSVVSSAIPAQSPAQPRRGAEAACLLLCFRWHLRREGMRERITIG